MYRAAIERRSGGGANWHEHTLLLVLLSMESHQVKVGSCMLLMQLASGFAVGFSKKVRIISSGQVLRACTAWPTPGTRKK